MKIRLTILTENEKPLPNMDIEMFEQKVKNAWQFFIDGLLLASDEEESATVEKVEVVREDGDTDGRS